jgi:hypothetical protein
MLQFDLHTREGTSPIAFAPAALIVAGWTGRDEAALRHHIEELAAIGVPRPSSVPVFYRNSVLNLTQAPALEVLGPDTSGEVEPVIVATGCVSRWAPTIPTARPRPRVSRCRSSCAPSRSGAGCGRWTTSPAIGTS